MKWCEAFLVHLVDVGSAFDELVHHHVLPVVAGHVEGCVAVCVGLVDLDIQDETVFPINTNRNLIQCFSWNAVILNPGQFQMVMQYLLKSNSINAMSTITL